MINGSTSYTGVFYEDPELNRETQTYDEDLDIPDLLSIYTFSTSNIGASAASFTPASPVDSYTEAYFYGLSPASFGAKIQDNGSDSSIPLLSNLHLSTETVESSQITQFWQLYNEYPKHLKTIKKRNRRKLKKQAMRSDSSQNSLAQANTTT